MQFYLRYGIYNGLLVSNTPMRSALRLSAISVLVSVGVFVTCDLLSPRTSRYFVSPHAQLTVQTAKQQGCQYVKSHADLSGYENVGPCTLDPLRLTKGRTDLREFLWTHWHDHKKGVAEARAGTIDRGTVKLLYLVEPDAKGQWGIDVELDRPTDPPCVAFHADSLVRVPIAKPDEDELQTSGGSVDILVKG